MIGIAWSGGKDSALLLWRAQIRGLNPVAVAVDTGFLSRVALKNIEDVPARLRCELRLVRPAPHVFRDIYADMLPTVPDDPFAMCAACHACIDRHVESALPCDAIIQDGFSPDEAALLPQGHGIAAMTADRKRVFPFLDKGEGYDARVVRTTLAHSNVLSMRRSDPMRTNCRINLLIIHDYWKAHGRNPYGEMFAAQSPANARRMARLIKLAWATGWLQWQARRLRRALTPPARD